MKTLFRMALVAALLSVSSLSITLGIQRTANALDHMRSGDEEMRTLVHVYDEVLQNYVDIQEATPSNLMEGAIYGMLNTLDPYSQYFPPKEYKKFTEQTQGEFGGLGIRIIFAGPDARWLPGWLTVVEPIKNSPATRCVGKYKDEEIIGLKPDDKIVEIEGESTRSMSIETAVDKLKGRPGTKVKIVVARKPVDGGEPMHPIEFEIERDIISVPPIEETDIRMVSKDIGYIWLKDFTSHAAEAVLESISKLKQEGMRALVLDLRDNTGGLLPVAIDICDLFVDKGLPIVSVDSRNDRDDEMYLSKRDPLTDVPLAILVNQHSASASEIVAGCMQDHDRATIVGPSPGTNTYGKGSVQTVLKLEDGSGLKLTTAYYYTPEKQRIHKHGIEPEAWSDMSVEYWMKLRNNDKVGYLKPEMIPGQNEAPKEGEENADDPVTMGELLGQEEPDKEVEDLYDKQLFLAAQLLRVKLNQIEKQISTETAKVGKVD
jgi:carboxyl-terminal processing protease